MVELSIDVSSSSTLQHRVFPPGQRTANHQVRSRGHFREESGWPGRANQLSSDVAGRVAEWSFAAFGSR